MGERGWGLASRVWGLGLELSLQSVVCGLQSAYWRLIVTLWPAAKVT